MIRSVVPFALLLMIAASCAVRAGGNDTTSVIDTTLRFVSPAEFTYAGARRATLYGDLPLAATHLDPVRSSVVGGIYLGALVGLHLNMKDAWWSTRSEFKLKNDWNDVLQIDKFGHAFAAYTMGYGISEGLMAAGVGWEPATVWGGVSALLYQSYVEMEDGFSEGWGFSPSDMGANTLGALLFIGQHYVPLLQNVTPKYQYVPPAWIDVPTLSATWIDDYNSSTFWYSINVYNLLPSSMRESWPRWLQFSFGYGIRVEEGERKTRRYILALDYDLVQLLPEGGHLWNWIRQTLNAIKLPAPALEFSPKPRLYLLFPFTF